MKVGNKSMVLTAVAASTWLMMGCASIPRYAVAPVGPNPELAAPVKNGDGQLEVFSSLNKQREGNEYDVDPAWYQHTDYNIYTIDGQKVEHVFNSMGHYSQSPRVIDLPPGKYVVSAHAQGFTTVDVPVVIKSGEVTKVHLDDKWNPPSDTPARKLVKGPDGQPVGWQLVPD